MADTNQILRLAAIIREVDGTHSKGAAALAESILNHPRFRAVLAGGPAVPEGREPASAAGGPSDEELNRLLWYEFTTSAGHGERTDPIAFARAVLARWGHQPAPPADGEVAELVAWLREQLHVCLQAPWTPGIKHFGRAAELLERQVPVPVSERMPGPKDCDAEGRCWWGRSESHDWSADWTFATYKAVAEFCEFSPQTTWLPAHSLPLPEVNV